MTDERPIAEKVRGLDDPTPWWRWRWAITLAVCTACLLIGWWTA